MTCYLQTCRLAALPRYGVCYGESQMMRFPIKRGMPNFFEALIGSNFTFEPT